MSDIAHALWASAAVIVAAGALSGVWMWLGLARRRIELDSERVKAVEALSKRFDDVQRVANELKLEWANVKLSRK